MTVSVDLTGRRVLVTGASSGIGAATCRTIVACGGSVAMLARRKQRLDDLHEELGERAVAIPADVTDLTALEAAIEEAANSLDGIDGVVTVAGKNYFGGMTTGTPQRWRDLLNLNLLGPLATMRFAYDHFPRDGRRDVVVVGSAGSITAMPGVGIYGASKRGLRAACESLRLELAPEGVNVSLIMPGMFDTEGLTLEGIEFDGSVPDVRFPVLAEGSGPGPVEGVADAIAFVMSLPEGIAINELVIRPTGEFTP